MSKQVTKHEIKKGGPYSEFDREIRQKKVFQLHIEYGYPAVKIAEMMKVNRNTINEDIKACYSKLSSYFDDQTLAQSIIKQIYRFEMQRAHLLGYLGEQVSLKEKLGVEKLIFELDKKILENIPNPSLGLRF